jgi:hypothetical protein
VQTIALSRAHRTLTRVPAGSTAEYPRTVLPWPSRSAAASTAGAGGAGGEGWGALLCVML